MEIDEASLAYDAHVEVGHGGHRGHAHDGALPDPFHRPFLSSSENYERWMRNGGKDTATRAGEIWRKRLEDNVEPPMDEAVKAQLQD